MGELLDERELAASAKGFHGNVVEEGFEGGGGVGLEIEEEEVSFGPRSEGVEQDEGVITGGSRRGGESSGEVGVREGG